MKSANSRTLQSRELAMETLQMSTVYAPPRAAAPLRFPSFSSKEKLHLPKYAGFKNPLLSFSSSPSSFTRSLSSSSTKSRVSCKAREAVDEVREVTDSSWNELVIGNESMVLVDFWAPWCGPCRMIAPVMEELAREYRGKIACFKLNTDDCPAIATQYGIRSIPTVLFFKNGQKKESVIGAVPKSTLSATIDKYLEL